MSDSGPGDRPQGQPSRDALRDEDPVLLGHDDHTPATAPAFWQGIVAPRETILWHGRPDPALRPAPRVRVGPPVLIAAVAIAGLALTLLLRQGGGMPAKVVALCVLLGAGLVVMRALPSRRRHPADIYYLITDRAAYMAGLCPGAPPDVRRHEITPQMPVTASDTSVRLQVGTRSPGSDRHDVPVYLAIGPIADAAAVRALIRNIQKGKP